jgi:propanol-preferring alcohol dehydrogenase
VLALAAAGRIHTRTTTYSLDDALTAYDHLHDGAVEGRAVVVP